MKPPIDLNRKRPLVPPVLDPDAIVHLFLLDGDEVVHVHEGSMRDACEWFMHNMQVLTMKYTRVVMQGSRPQQ